MKAYHFVFFALILATSSCVREEVIKLDSSASILTLNANYVAGSTENVVSASLTRADGSKPVASDAVLTVTTAGGSSQFTGSAKDFWTCYYPDLKVEAGETLELSITVAGQTASASCTVPKAPQVGECYMRSSTLVPTYCRFDLEVIDEPGQDNYYRLLPVANINEIRVYDAKTGDFIRNENTHPGQMLSLDTMFEPLLGGFTQNTDMDDINISQMFNSINEYLVFDDNSFKDDKYSLSLAFDMASLVTLSENERYQVDFTLFLYALTFEGYHNYKAAQTRELFGSSTIITEPAIFPTNVQGGTGLVVAETPVSVNITCSYPRRR